MKDTEILSRLYTKVDLLGLGNEQARFAKWVAAALAIEVAKIIKEEAKKPCRYCSEQP
jgi:hypothetical protein